MSRPSAASLRAFAVLVVASVGLAGCAQQVTVTKVRLSERECLARAMYFESNRSSDAGMLAVGTVVMNRLKSGRYGATVCEVVGAPRQFAPGVLSRPMLDRGAPRARRMADVVLSGKRHPGVQNAQFFHTAGYKFPYNNMRYVLVAGGNAFYDKTKAPKTWWGGEGRWGPPPAPDERIDGVMVAKVEVIEDQPQRETRMAAAAPMRRPAETRIVETRQSETRMADARGSYGGVPTYEPLPTERAVPARNRPIVVAELDQRGAPGRAIREDQGLREEDRWRDQELAEETGRQPASDVEWRERRDESVEMAALPEVEPRPEPAMRRPTRIASRDESYGGDFRAPAPVSAPAAYEPRRPAPRQVSARAHPIEADPAAMGWRTGAQPVRSGEPADAYDPAPEEAGMGGYRPLSRAAEDDDYRPAPASRRAPAARQASRAYEEQDVRAGYR